MGDRQRLRSEETKQDILAAAEKLFGKRGFDAVSMREIAKQAGCSHTTIYLYFENKEALLHQLSMPPLKGLKQKMEDTLKQTNLPREERLKSISRQFIYFCLSNRTMYTIFFYTKSSRVDEENPELEVNNIRIQLFELLKQGLKDCLQMGENNPSLLTFSRIYFFTLHGIVGTYHNSEESAEALITRLETTFDDAVEVLLYGFKHKMEQGAGTDENRTNI
ncbi:MAG TPA: TetR/AcrR family transcriptional regulator [Bacillales bacterium]|nr:TetR/AcrR family transcriptional regulator [Bacillales bacterium]